MRKWAFEEVERLRTFGWYQPSDENPNVYHFIIPTMVKSMDDMRKYVSQGFKVYKKNHRYYANVPQEHRTCDLSKYDEEESNEGQITMTAFIQRRLSTSAPATTTAHPDIPEGMFPPLNFHQRLFTKGINF